VLEAPTAVFSISLADIPYLQFIQLSNVDNQVLQSIMHLAKKLALGTAQFGLDYGVSNKSGKVSMSEMSEILEQAQKAGINTLDTALGYGSAESQLGSAGMSKWRIISKIPAIPNKPDDVWQWMESSLDLSLSRLQVEKISGLLLHHGADLLGNNGDLVFNCLFKLKLDERIEKIGVSIYNFDELATIVDRYEIDLIQAPFNCFDQRLLQKGLLDMLQNKGIEVHIRSVFLQGLLLMPRDSRPAYFDRWQPLWDNWENWRANYGIDPIEACLGLPLSTLGIDRTLIGVDSLPQLSEILARLNDKPPGLYDRLKSNDIELINPSIWKI
jgi:aryl-alcohol dehydrogenase-like predicted oxidoreductase